jgi:ABC-type branched-subunit amino acid transport system permease subunit
MGRSNLIGLCLFALCIALAPVALGHTLYQFIPLGALALMAIGLSLLMGYAGQISLGQCAFYAVGAYTSAICSAKLGWSPWITIPLAATLAALVALLVGMPSLRLRGHYLAMAPLAFGEIGRIILDGWIELTGGSSYSRGSASDGGVARSATLDCLQQSDQRTGSFLSGLGTGLSGAVARAEPDSFAGGAGPPGDS